MESQHQISFHVKAKTLDIKPDQDITFTIKRNGRNCSCGNLKFFFASLIIRHPLISLIRLSDLDSLGPERSQNKGIEEKHTQSYRQVFCKN